MMHPSHTNQGNYYPAFVILSKTLEDYVRKIHIHILILNYFYLGLLIMCFLLSLAFIGFDFITIYMTV
jgi:hypothetical protein